MLVGRKQVQAVAEGGGDVGVERTGVLEAGDAFAVVADPLAGVLGCRRLLVRRFGRGEPGRGVGEGAVDAADDRAHVEGVVGVHVDPARVRAVDPRGEVVGVPAQFGHDLA